MNHVNLAADDVANTKPYLELIATTATSNSKNIVDRTSGYPLGTADYAANDPFFGARVGGQVREDRSFYVPDILADEDYDDYSETYSAAEVHAKHLRNAERLVCQAEDLVGLMRAAIHHESDARAMQADTALAVIEKKLSRAHSRINKHDRRHSNLFLAYFRLENKAGHGAE